MATDVVPITPTAPKRTLAALVERERRRQRARQLRLAAYAGVLVLLALGAFLWFRPEPVPLAARFREALVTHGDIVREVNATGRLAAITTVQVGAEISGRVASVEVDFNDRVQRGQVLARFDKAALDAQYAQASATLAAARATLQQAKTDRERRGREEQRALALFSTGSMSAVARDDASAAARLAEQQVAAAEAEVAARLAAHQLAQTNLAHAVIESPIDGVIITRTIDPGQTVASALQTPVLFTVAADLRKMEVIAAVDEADIGEVEEGQRASFTVHAYPERVFEARVTAVRNAAQVVQDVVTYGVELSVDNLDLALKPGMTASVRIRTQAARDVLRVPVAALGFVPPGERATPGTVWVVSEGALRAVSVAPGISDGEQLEIVSKALRAGDRVLVDVTPAGRAAYGLPP